MVIKSMGFRVRKTPKMLKSDPRFKSCFSHFLAVSMDKPQKLFLASVVLR